MIKIESTTITSQNKDLLGQDLTGYTLTAQIRNLTAFKERFRFNDKEAIESKWEGDGEEKTIRIEIIEKISNGLFDPNVYEAVVMDGNSVKHWSTIIVDKDEHLRTEYSPEASIRFFGLQEVDVDNDGNLCDIWIFKNHGEESLIRLKAAFELCPDASLYHALKRKKREARALEEKLELYENWKKKIDDIKEDDPNTYSEITYWKELEIKAFIEEIRVQLYGPLAYIDLEKYWYEHFRSLIDRKELVFDKELWFSMKTRKPANPKELISGEIVIKFHRQENRFWLDLIKLAKSDSYRRDGESNALDFDEEKIIDKLVVTLDQKRFYFKRKNIN